MSNYNDGKWHGWNGGECPVHPESTIETVFSNGTMRGPLRGASFLAEAWGEGGIIAFRVVKEHREPREFWISKHNICYVLPHKPESNDPAEFIHVREVTEQ